jgi:hypothetical protein
VQLELSEGLRKAGDWGGLAGAVRTVLEDLNRVSYCAATSTRESL